MALPRSVPYMTPLNLPRHANAFMPVLSPSSEFVLRSPCLCSLATMPIVCRRHSPRVRTLTPLRRQPDGSRIGLLKRLRQARQEDLWRDEFCRHRRSWMVYLSVRRLCSSPLKAGRCQVARRCDRGGSRGH